MSERDSALRKLSAVEFARWELHVYLDTHPGDKSAIAKLEEYEKKAKTMRREYEAKFGALTLDTSWGADEWLSNPWPWDYDKEDDK